MNNNIIPYRLMKLTMTDNIEDTDKVLSVNLLAKAFGNVQAVDGLSFFIKKGEIYGLLGPNGAGKTTTIKLILGLLEADTGEISVLGLNPENDEVELKNRIGYVSEEPLIFKSLTPKELFNFVASVRHLKGPEISERLAEYMESLEALQYYEKLIQTLSRGNKQKIQIIAALLHNPELLIMDEPLTGLDAKAQKVIKEILELHTERGGSVLFSTHIMKIAEELCDRIGIVTNGQLVAEGTIQELNAKAHSAGASLEDVFLKLTDQDESVNQIIENLRKTSKNFEKHA
jgi:ABC-2 type transport system ATP-binding protein